MSPRTHRAPRLVPVTAALAGVLLLGSTGAPAALATHPEPAGPAAATDPGLYLVTLTGHGTASHPDTRPAPGRRLDRSRLVVRALADRLRGRQDRVLTGVGDPEVVHRWTTALNGFAARLDAPQVKALRRDPRVALVERSTVQRTASEAVARAAVPRGLERRLRELRGPDAAGTGVVVGLVDSGVWPENPAFAGLPQQQPGRSDALPGFQGACAEGERWSAADCNDKIVSARWFVAGFGPGRVATHEVLSPRDVTGHGSHTASTIAGESVDVEIDGQRFGRSAGVVPGARLAVYKACWAAPDPTDDGCATADTVTAVDRAVADGVDVLAYAVTGSPDPTDTVSRAFLGAARAGVFVAAAAGNDGPGHATVDHAAPWVTTVGAATHLRYAGSVLLDDGTALDGAMVSDRQVDGPLVHGRDLAAPGATAEEAARCETGSLHASLAEGAVVVCDRGVVPRVEKSAAVAAAGGTGMVLVNTGPDTVDSDVHAVPTVHLPLEEGRRLVARLREDDDLQVSLRPRTSPDREPRLAASSGRGPVSGAEVLKPDVVAPGAAVLGAVAPVDDEELWDLRSGTSVGAAHVAGLAALLTSEHPRWDPSALHSALVTTADPMPGTGGPLDEGAGHVDVEELLDPGLVLESRGSAYRRFLDGELPGRDLNAPSIVVDDLVGRTTVTRRLTNVGGAPSTYTAQVQGLDGYEVTVRPGSLRLAPGQTRRVRIVARATPAASVRQHATGDITWTGLRHQVRVPVVLKASAVQAPSMLRAEVDDGAVTVRGRSGTGRPVRPAVAGLAGASPIGLSLRPGTFSPGGAGIEGDTFSTDVSVPSGAQVARFEVRSHNLADDLDLRVHRDGAVVAEATGPAASAVVTLVDPAAGDYRVEVRAARAGNGAVATGELTSWVVGAGGAGTLDVDVRSPGTGPGSAFRYDVRWPELDATRRWLGVVRYPGSDERTLLRIG